jgi:hypothetical protein
MRGLTASSLPRVARCPASAVLRPRADRDSEWATAGTDAHSALREVITDGEVVTDVPEELADALGDPTIRDAPWRSEVAAWWHPDGRAGVLGEDLGRDYGGAPAGAICGTIDLLAVTADAVSVADLKSGHRWQPRPEDHWQLRFHGLAFAAAMGRRRATLRILLTASGEPVWLRYDAGPADLRRWRAGLRQILADVAAAQERVSAGETPDVRAGEHCRYCPARDACPAHRSALVAVASATPSKDLSRQIRTHEDAAVVLDAVRQYELAAAEVARVLAGRKAEVYQFLTQRGPAKLADGRTIAAVEAGQAKVADHARLAELMREQLGDVADAHIEVRPHVTLRDMARAARAAAKTRELSGRQLAAEVRARAIAEGAVTVTGRETLRLE